MNKPIIRHCKNCEYRTAFLGDYCDVKYKKLYNGMSLRLRALLCRYYKQKEGAE